MSWTVFGRGYVKLLEEGEATEKSVHEGWVTQILG